MTGRDDLSIDAHGLRGLREPTMLESADASSLIEDWIDESSNLPLELKRMQDERSERNQRIDELVKIITQRDLSMQKFIRLHGSHTPNPKEAEYRKVILENQAKVRLLLDENVKQGMEMKRILEKRMIAFDKGVKKLKDRGELQDDPELPSLLRPEIPAQPADRSSDLMNSAFLPTTSNIPSSNPYRNAGRNTAVSSNSHRATPQQNSTSQQSHHATIPTISAIPAAVTTQKARESSAGASNKRPRLTGNLSIPQVPGNLARQSSLGPGTPKGNLSSSSRAGSAGPRPPKTGSAATKKFGPPGKGSSISRKSNLGKSSISRVKRAQGGSPSSTNDSEHSEGDTASHDDDEPSTPPVDGNGDTAMVDQEEDTDNNKYCICQSTSFGDMVACDNDKCPYEWFHWDCVGITKTPPGSWFCNTPACNKTMENK